MKRVFDVIFSVVLLIILCPVLLTVAAAVRIAIGSPVIFSQERVGLNEKQFTLKKFRSMSDLRDTDGVLLPDEARLGHFGRMLRSTSLDELPGLLNVLNGDMSFVGPRPLLVEYLELYSEQHKKRHSVRPGITGLAQVSGRNSISWGERLDLDVHYVENRSFLMDFKILMLTILRVLSRADISSKNSATMEKFDGRL